MTIKFQVNNTSEMEPLLLKVLKELDFAVRESDPIRSKQLIDLLEEEFDLGFEESFTFADDQLTDEEIQQFIKKIEEEIQIFEDLKAENGPEFVHKDISSSFGQESLQSLSKVTTESSAEERLYSSQKIRMPSKPGEAKVTKFKI